MMAINILVIDDDRKMAERLMRGLQRADKENVLGECGETGYLRNAG